MTKIKGPAIKTPDGEVATAPIGKHHKDIRKREHIRKGTPGFTTSAGEFVNRKEGAKIAKKAGQVDKLPTPHLHSENLKKRKLPTG